MDDQRFTDKLRHAANSEVVRRLLIRYFVRKGFDNFDVPIYPPTLMDLPALVPELTEHVEIVPHSRDIDPLNDSAELGWNLFVLGTHRQYLGESFHHNLHTLSLMLQQNQIIEEDKVATHQTTPRQIIHFVTRALAQNRAGYVDLTPRVNTAAMPRVGAGISKPFYTKPGGMHCG